MKKHKILIVCPRYSPVLSGAETQIHQIAKSLYANNFCIDVFTLNVENDFFTKKKVFSYKQTIDNINIYRFSPTILPMHNRFLHFLENRGISKYITGYRRVFSINMIKQNIDNYDTIIVGVMPFTGIIYPMLNKSRKRGIKTVLIPFIHLGIPHDNRFEYEYFSEYCVQLYKMSDAIIVNSDIEREFLIKKGYMGKIMRINPFIDISIEKREKRKEFIICTLGYNNYEKGIDTSIKAFNRFSKKYSNVKFEIGGYIEKKYEEIAKQNKHIIIHNKMNDIEKKEMFKRCSLFIQPSMAESLGIATLEAHRCFIPSINAFCSGSMSIIKNGENGFLVPFGDNYLLYEYMDLFYNNRYLLEKMSLKAHSMSYNYDYNNHIKGIELLEEFIK